MNPNILGLECKNVAYSTDKDKEHDYVLVKEVVHTKDGKYLHRLRHFVDPKRPVYLTKPHLRNHQEKKENEELKNCIKYMTTDVQMSKTIQLGLGYSFPDPHKSLRQVCKSPYVYWADLKVTTYIKEKYQHKYKDLVAPNRLAIFDIETEEVEGLKTPIICSVVCEDEIHIAMPDFYADRAGTDDHITSKIKELLAKVPFNKKNKETGKMEEITKDLISGYKIFYHRASTAGRAIRALFTEIHRLLPDLLVAWNVDFDISHIIKCLQADGIALEDVFCHPDVPEEFRSVWYKQDAASKKTESKKLTKSPDQQWHVLYCQASFYMIDAMSLFRSLRIHEGRRPSFGLAAILKTEVGVGKLDIPGLPYSEGLKWHVAAQRDFPAEYVAYNIMDLLLILLLDEKTGDLTSAISTLAGLSTYDIFPSMPKRICDAYTYFLLYEYDCVIGSVGSDIRNDFDDENIGMDGWIVTLKAYMNDENGLYCLNDSDTIKTAFRGQTADADLTQAYPSATNALNQSRETTLFELTKIEGVSELTRRHCGIDLAAGKVNAMAIANEMFLLPDKDDVVAKFELWYANATEEEKRKYLKDPDIPGLVKDAVAEEVAKAISSPFIYFFDKK